MQPREVGGSWKQEASLRRNVGSARATSREHTGLPAANRDMGALAAAGTDGRRPQTVAALLPYWGFKDIDDSAGWIFRNQNVHIADTECFSLSW